MQPILNRLGIAEVPLVEWWLQLFKNTIVHIEQITRVTNFKTVWNLYYACFIQWFVFIWMGVLLASELAGSPRAFKDWEGCWSAYEHFFIIFFYRWKVILAELHRFLTLRFFLDLKKNSVWYVSDIKSPSILSSSSRKDRVRENKLKELTFSQPSMKTWDWERHECGRSLQHIAKYTRYNTRVLPSSQCHGRVWASPVHRIGQPASVF